MSDRNSNRKIAVAILLALTAALLFRAWLELRLRQLNVGPNVAADLSYLVVPMIMLLTIAPVWRTELAFLSARFRLCELTLSVALSALAVGVLIRVIWWAQLIGGVAFGYYTSPDPSAPAGPGLSFQCAAPATVVLGVGVMAVLVPVVEEVVHRGYVQSALSSYGAGKAIVASALVFALFHNPGSWPFAFLAGLVFGFQYWTTQSLWSPLISHATINGLIQFDWRCMSGYWNPSAEQIPVLPVGIFAATVLVIAATMLVFTLSTTARVTTRARGAPR